MLRNKIAVAVAVALGSFMTKRGLALGVLAVTLEKDAHGKLPKEVQSLYVEKEGKFVLDLPDNYEDVTAVKGALQKERDAKKEAERLFKELTKKFEGIDPDSVRKLLEKIDGDEEATLIKAGKLQEVVDKRMAKANEAHAKAMKLKDDEIAKGIERNKKYQQRVLDNHVRAAATKAGLHPNAVDDALFRARTIFSLDDEGNAVQLDGDGKVVLGKDAKSPYSVDEWITGMKETAPHWFPSGNSGGGAGGDKGGKGGTARMTRKEFDALDTVTKATKAKEMNAGTLQIVD